MRGDGKGRPPRRAARYVAASLAATPFAVRMVLDTEPQSKKCATGLDKNAFIEGLCLRLGQQSYCTLAVTASLAMRAGQ